MSSREKEFNKAKDYAYRLLSYRQRSIKELSGRLQKKGFSSAISSKTIDYLTRYGYLNDEDFARAWVSAKIQSSPLGWSLMRRQLKQKGVCEEIVQRVIGSFAGQYDEYDTACSLIKSRLKYYKRLAPLRQRGRLYAYLQRRGFSHEVILQALRLNEND